MQTKEITFNIIIDVMSMHKKYFYSIKIHINFNQTELIIYFIFFIYAIESVNQYQCSIYLTNFKWFFISISADEFFIILYFSEFLLITWNIN